MKQKFTVLRSFLKCNGGDYNEGDPIELDDDDDALIIDDLLEKHSIKEGYDVDPENDEPTDDDIIIAMKSMLESDPEKEDEGMWTNDGKPEVKYLKSIGVEISATKRDQLWAAVE